MRQRVIHNLPGPEKRQDMLPVLRQGTMLPAPLLPLVGTRLTPPAPICHTWFGGGGSVPNLCLKRGSQLPECLRQAHFLMDKWVVLQHAVLLCSCHHYQVLF